VRRALLAVVPLLASACSLVESFDGYTGGGDDAAVDGAPGDVTTDSIAPGDARVDTLGDTFLADTSDDTTPPGETSPPPDVPIDTFPGPGDYLCVFGGTADSSLTPKGEVWCAHLATDGSPETWIAQTPLPEALSEMAVISDGTHVWVVGGRNAAGFSSTIYATAIGSDGRLGAWSSIGTLPAGRRGLLAFAWSDDTLVVHGGETAAGGAAPTVHATMSFGGGTLGSWASETSSDAPAYGAGVLFKNSVYVLDGRHGGTTLDEADRYPLGGGTGYFGGPYDQTSAHLSPTRSEFALALHAASTGTGDYPRIFALGGDDGAGPLDDVTFSDFRDGTDGSGGTVPNVLTSWKTNASHLVHARSGHAVAQTAGEHVFVVGGFLVGGAATAEVEQATVAGETLSFSSTLALPAPRAFAGAAVVTL
jgi:N-acetylneuraminic acid mutarotase